MRSFHPPMESNTRIPYRDSLQNNLLREGLSDRILRRRRLHGRAAKGYFKSETENSVWMSRGDSQQLPTHFFVT